MGVSLSGVTARRVALGAQGFADALPKSRVDRRHLRRIMARQAVLQLDSVPVVCRSHYLPVFARLGPYRSAQLDFHAWHSGEWYETWGHEASVMAVETEPLLRWRRAASASGATWAPLYRLAQKEKSYIDAVHQQVIERGPLTAGELDDPRPQKGEWWGSRSLGSVALDWLFRIGELGIRRSPTFEKRFEKFSSIVGPEILAQPTPSETDAHRSLLEIAGSSLGVATAADLADYFRLPMRSTRERIAELVEEGRLIEAHVEGWGAPGYLASGATRPRSIDRVTVLSPFDPIVWFRPRAERLFGFSYKIEIYTPKAKRKYGYYVLPFLLGDELVGRVDLKSDRSHGVLRVLGAFAEQRAGVDPGAVAAALIAHLEVLGQHLGMQAVEVSPECRGDLARLIRHCRAPA